MREINYSIGYKTREGDIHNNVVSKENLEVTKSSLTKKENQLMYIREVKDQDVRSIIETCDINELKVIIDTITQYLYRIYSNESSLGSKLPEKITRKYRYLDYDLKNASVSKLSFYHTLCINRFSYMVQK